MSLEVQAKANLLWQVSPSEAILRLLLNEHTVEQALTTPHGYDPMVQDDWIDSLLTFIFRRSIKQVEVQREWDRVTIKYNFGDFGYWLLGIEPERVLIEGI